MQPRVAELPEGPEWSYEIKWDGWRALAIKDGETVQLLSRTQRDLSARFPDARRAVERVSGNQAVIDGELVVFGPDGKPSFNLVQNWPKGGGRLAFIVFDLLHVDGVDIRDRPLSERRKRLESVTTGSGLVLSGELKGRVRDLIPEARRMGLEGIVAKRRDCSYVCGEAGDWVKHKVSVGQEFVVGGYVPPINPCRR
jgi:bifunctional non-homologous end joining protein LigD